MMKRKLFFFLLCYIYHSVCSAVAAAAATTITTIFPFVGAVLVHTCLYNDFKDTKKNRREDWKQRLCIHALHTKKRRAFFLFRIVVVHLLNVWLLLLPSSRENVVKVWQIAWFLCVIWCIYGAWVKFVCFLLLHILLLCCFHWNRARKIRLERFNISSYSGNLFSLYIPLPLPLFSW